jgi:uncharacterized heparinase superfamily protein
MNKLFILFQTLRHLKFVQIRYQLWYRIRIFLRKITGFKYPLPIQKKGGDLILSEWILKPISFEGNTFTFLNLAKIFPAKDIDWDFSNFGKLWTYNLNYFDFLNQSKNNIEEKLELIRDFIEKLDSNSTAIEPYTIALRGINWIKFLSKHEFEISDQGLLDKVNSSLYAQYQILLNNLEYHLLGNHLLEDGFSILFGAFHYNDKKLFRKANQIIIEELREQILEDGGHFELSPMYHQIILDRLLDCINLLQNNQKFDGQENLVSAMKDKANKMLEWLNAMTFANGEIPLFNDSTSEIAPSTGQINKYVDRLKIGHKTLNIKLSASGYRSFNNSKYECYIDVGQIGPNYQPGHAHADTFNFVLNVKNVPFIVDTGISTYNPGKNRLNERSTSSHNTVTISDKNSSQVWSSFRVARRAKVEITRDDHNNVTAQHSGYQHLNAIHLREWNFIENEIQISDRLKGKNSDGKAYLILAPSTKPKLNGSIIECELATLTFQNAKSIKIISNHIPDAYNSFSDNYNIEVSFEGHLETVITIK